MAHHDARLLAPLLVASAVLAGCGQASSDATKAGTAEEATAGSGGVSADGGPSSPDGGAITAAAPHDGGAMYGGGNGGAHQGTESMGAAGAQSGETEASMTGYELSDFPRCGDANLVSLRAACGSTPSEPTFVESGGGSRSSPCTSSS